MMEAARALAAGLPPSQMAPFGPTAAHTSPSPLSLFSPSHLATAPSPFHNSVPFGHVISPRDTSRIVLYSGMALYGAAIVVGIVDVIWNLATNRYETHTAHKDSKLKIESRAVAVEKLFKILLFICLIFRVAWLLMRTFWSNDVNTVPTLVTFATSRLAFGFFFSCFTLVVFYWAESVHSSTYASEEFLPKLGMAFLVSNGVMWVFQIIVVSLFLSGTPFKEGNPVYEANIIVELSLSLVLSLGFAFYGTSLWLMRCRSEYHDPSRFRYTVTSTIVTVLFVLCFALRVVAFGYRYVFRTYLDPNVFMIIAYYIPELVPALLQIYLVESSKARVNTADQYIADLYAGEAEKSLEEALRTGSTPSLRFGLGARRAALAGATASPRPRSEPNMPPFNPKSPERHTWAGGQAIDYAQSPSGRRTSGSRGNAKEGDKAPLLTNQRTESDDSSSGNSGVSTDMARSKVW